MATGLRLFLELQPPPHFRFIPKILLAEFLCEIRFFALNYPKPDYEEYGNESDEYPEHIEPSRYTQNEKRHGKINGIAREAIRACAYNTRGRFPHINVCFCFFKRDEGGNNKSNRDCNQRHPEQREFLGQEWYGFKNVQCNSRHKPA